MLLPPDYIIISSWCLWMLAYDCFSSFSSLVAYFNAFGICEKLCRVNFSWHALHSLCITHVEPWWMHCQQGGENCTNHTSGEMHHSRGSFACIVFERGSSVSGGAFVTWLILFYHMIGVEPFLPFCNTLI